MTDNPEPDAPSASPRAPEPPPILVALHPPDADLLGPERMSFTGTGVEYFRIWIVNLALTIITLGVYSAWAKVRRLQFFYRHTRVAGAGFDYHGDPVAILKGRIVGLFLFGLYYAAGYMNPGLAAVIFVALAAVMPWLLGRSLRFRLHNSSYRGIRFRFHGTTGQAYWVFLGLPVLAALSLFTLIPFWHQRLKRYQFAGAAYGRSRFSFGAGVGKFYVTYLLAGFAFASVFLGVSLGVAATGRRPPDGSETDTATLALVGVVAFAYVVAAVAGKAITTARIQNHCWSSVRLDRHRFVSKISTRKLFGILFTNLLGMVVTIGLFRPFAQVRLARYLAGVFTVVPAAGFEAFAAAESVDVTAVGDETAELFDFDIAF
jgi:uncharacterized membrane protein YjgN (DUF898 family)